MAAVSSPVPTEVPEAGPSKARGVGWCVRDGHMVDIELDSSDGKVAIEMGETVTKFVPPDGGHGWKVAIATSVLTFFLTGFMRSGGKFGSYVRADFPGTVPTESGWIFGLSGTLSLLISPITAILLAKFGSLTMVLSGLSVCALGLFSTCFATSVGYMVVSIGVCFGIGSSFVSTSTVACTGKYFTTRKPAAITIALSGGCLGAIVMPYIVAAFLGAIGMKYTCVVFGGLFVLLCALGVLYGPPEDHFVAVTEEVVKSPEVAVTVGPVVPQSLLEKLTEFVAVRCGCSFLLQRDFQLLVIALFFAQLGNPTYKGLLGGAAKAMGTAPELSAHLATFGAVAELAVRLIYGFRRGPPRLSRYSEVMLLLAVTSLSVVLMAFSTAYWQLVVLSIVAAVSTSSLAICTPLLVSELHGAAKLASAGSVVKLGQGLANLVGRPVTGAINANYGATRTLALCATYLFLGTLTAFTARSLKYWREQRPVERFLKWLKKRRSGVIVV